jgi:PAS domain S-box-containing protein/putative nucleotidyltransferase with HDIG domain
VPKRRSECRGHDRKSVATATGGHRTLISHFWSEALRDSQQLTFVLDTDKRVLAISDGFVARLGYEQAQMLGGTCRRALRHECTEACPFTRAGLETPYRATEVHCDALDGDFYLTVTPFPDSEGAVAGYVYAAVDISERRRTEEALRVSETRYRNVVEHAPVAIFQSTPDGEGIYVSPAYATLMGWESADDLLDAIKAASVQDLLYADPCKRKEYVDEVHTAGGDWRVFENVYRRKDGSLIEALLYLSEQKDAVTGEAFLYGFIQDVTAERRSLRELEKSTAVLTEAERLAHLGSWEWNLRSGMTRRSNEWQRIHGADHEEMLVDECMAFVHPDDVRTVEEAMEDVSVKGSPYHARYRIIRRGDGAVRHLEGFGRPVLGPNGSVERVYGATLDITESVESHEALEDRERRLQTTLQGAIAALGATVRVRDPYTAGHEERVAELASRIAACLGWDEVEVEMLRTAALVHDIGKIAVPGEILSKPARLTEAEFRLVKGHCRAGHDILAPIAFDWPIADIVLQHHERHDGSGYPEGLSGDAILPGARVLAVADTVEAMVSHRPYRAALPLSDAIAELEDGMGVRYDEQAAAACLELMREEEFLPFAVAGSD